MKGAIKVGLIGFGMGGRVFHAPIFTSVEGFQLSKVFERNVDNIHNLNKKYPETKAVKEVSEIIDDQDIDLVVVAARSDMHYEIAKEALKAGKHVVVEKPFTVTTDEADELIKLSKETGKLLTAHQNRRWDSDFKTVKKVIESGLLGNVVEYEAHYDRFRNQIKETWKEENVGGTGALYDLGSHLIDQTLSLFGMPRSIMGDIRVLRENGKIVDNFEVILNYEKVKATIKTSLLVRENGPRYIIHGDKGSFVKYGLDVQEEALKSGLSPRDLANWGEEPQDIWGIINTEYKGLNLRGRIESERGDYRGFYENVRNAIRGEEPLEILPEQARNTIRIIELAMKSSNEKKVITL